MNLYTTCCDVLEFDVVLTQEDGTAFKLEDNDKLWFAVKAHYADEEPLVYVLQHDTHFKIDGKKNEIPAGVYHYELGILFSDNTERTLINSKLYVNNKIKGHAYD